ncbi:hypothetical protein VTN77DRAFT_4553 [Rasamsonia byssochlamydoides]|uniref:uncharacterized protein n=1 Tax=Rasamsonia byssochlamydoides TaxID=89139 RepID=UPI003741F373
MIIRPSLLRPVSALDSASLCSRCLSRLAQGRPSTGSLRRSFVTTCRQSGVFHREYFSSHEPLARSSVRTGLLASSAATRTASINTSAPANSTPIASASEISHELPHRRRKRLKEEEEANTNATEPTIPLDASARLSAISSALPTTSLRRKLTAYFALTKPRLSFLILLSTTSAYGLYPISSLLTLDPAVAQPTLSTSTLTFLYLTTGTFLSSASANALNMFFEPKYDARMTRTRNRPLVRGLVSTRGAVLFAIATGVVGVGLLYVGTNPTVAALSAANICLYAFAYTPLKRIHVVNTWVGAVVGAIPPMMGWVAAAGQTATTGHDTWRDMLLSEDSIGGWLLAALLFAWQFPHFNSLSHLIREEYKAAGHQMMAWVNPARNARVALRYSILMFPIAFGMWYIGIVNDWFLVSSTLANGWLVKEAYQFWKHQGAKGSARGLFWASVWQLPILLVGGLVTKTGVWDGVWRRIVGEPEEDDDEYYDDEEDDETDVHVAQRPEKGVALSTVRSTSTA